MPPLGWLGVMIIVLFFVCVPPLGWLGVMIIVWVFVLRATPWLARGYDYRFLVVIECVSNFWCVCVYFLARWGSIPQRSWCLVTLLFIGEPNHKALHSPPWVGLDV